MELFDVYAFETKLDPVSPESVQKVKSSCPAVNTSAPGYGYI
jgi:hypothetical protein